LVGAVFILYTLASIVCDLIYFRGTYYLDQSHKVLGSSSYLMQKSQDAIEPVLACIREKTLNRQEKTETERALQAAIIEGMLWQLAFVQKSIPWFRFKAKKHGFKAARIMYPAHKDGIDKLQQLT